MSQRKHRLPDEDPAAAVADQLHSAAIHLLRRVRVRDTESGIGPAQLSALSVLVFGGPRSLTELADAEQVKPPTMSRIVAGLERGQLVRRLATPDRRVARVVVTARGRQLLWAGRRRRIELLARALRELPAEERQRAADLAAFLALLVRRL